MGLCHRYFGIAEGSTEGLGGDNEVLRMLITFYVVLFNDHKWSVGFAILVSLHVNEL